MKKYMTPEIEKVEYDVADCLYPSGEPASAPVPKEKENANDLINGI